jgi:formylglycine-generating enzyme required for sulfatase activity
MRPLRVFLCHASQDKPAVRELYKRLAAEAWIDPWLDEENLLPGQDFDLEIYKATRDADAIIICLSKVSVAKEGYVNKEIRRALDISQEKGEGAIYVIPLRLDECSPSFERLKQLHWVDYFAPNAHEKLLKALRVRATTLKIEIPEPKATPLTANSTPLVKDDDADLYRFIKIDLGSHSPAPYPFWIAKYPVTNRQYARFLQADDFAKEEYWLDFPKYDENCKPIGAWKDDGLKWLQEQLKDYTYFPHEQWKVEPRHWNDPEFGISQPNNPVVGINWYEANAYCKWLTANYESLPERQINSSFIASTSLSASLHNSSLSFRLPLDIEWTIAAGGDLPKERCPWDKPGKATTDTNEIKKRANIKESGIGHTTPVNQYSEGKSPFGVMDMAGNVWEWQGNYYDKDHDYPSLRGGSWLSSGADARISIRRYLLPINWDFYFGFRVFVSLPREASL